MEQNIKQILTRLEENGFEAYIVGGYVRDFLLGRNTSDVDIATNAKPEQVQKVFSDKECIDHSKFGSVWVEDVEITTFRKDTYNIGNRFPMVTFVSTMKEDAIRRDFTINALYMNKNGKIFDPLDRGIEDLKRKVIKTIKEPNHSFEEDPLRMIRAIRFSRMLNFTLDSKVQESLNSEKLQQLLRETVSVKRVQKEIEKGKKEFVNEKEYDFILKK